MKPVRLRRAAKGESKLRVESMAIDGFRHPGGVYLSDGLYFGGETSNDAGTIDDVLVGLPVANDETDADPFAAFLSGVVAEQARLRCGEAAR